MASRCISDDRSMSRIVSKTGYCTPPAIVGCALTAMGAGLMTMFTPSTPAGKWIGYQILIGAGRGLSMQVVGLFSYVDGCRTDG